MGSQLNFKKLGNEPPGDGGGGMNRLSQGITPLTRQGSIYSLTFDEFQSSLGKDFGSLNMDELLKNIWSAEETQAMASTSGIPVSGQNDLQRQGSLTLPRTLSQKTVDEVWKDLSKEYISGKDRRVGGANMSQTHSQRQQTLGEVTLEEFLVRAGVVREENQMASNLMPDKGGFFGNQLPASASPVRFQQASGVAGLMANLGPDTANHMQAQGSSLPLNVNGVRSIDQQHHCVQQQPPIMPKQPGFGYGTKIGLPSGQVTNPGIRGGLMGLGDQSLTNNMGLVQGGLGLTGAVGVGAASPVTPLSSEEIGKSNGDSSSLSPSPYMFNSGVRGTKSSGAVEKVVERRQRRMIKNRESAARSRARKQAYTVELEAEVAKLKEENEQLQRKQAEILEMQKNQPRTTDDNNERQEMEMMNHQEGPQKRLRRTQSGPW